MYVFSCFFLAFLGFCSYFFFYRLLLLKILEAETAICFSCLGNQKISLWISDLWDLCVVGIYQSRDECPALRDDSLCCIISLNLFSCFYQTLVDSGRFASCRLSVMPANLLPNLDWLLLRCTYHNKYKIFYIKSNTKIYTRSLKKVCRVFSYLFFVFWYFFFVFLIIVTGSFSLICCSFGLFSFFKWPRIACSVYICD